LKPLLFVMLLLPAVVSTAQLPNFEVASIRPNKSGEANWTWGLKPGGRFTGENMPVKGMILAAFRLKRFEVSGAPAWTDSERYDIIAKADNNASFNEAMFMLQGLLADRFKLQYHRTEKETSVFALLPARGGPSVTATKPGSCVPPNYDKKAQGAPQGDLKFCGWRVRGGEIEGTGVSMSEFADTLSAQMDRPVIDRTGIRGNVDVHLAWTPDGDTADTNGDPIGPSLFTAIEQQMGLRLESSKGLVKMLVIDHIDRPSEN